MEWKYCSNVIEEPPKGFIGFIYQITFNDGMSYVGKKNFFTKRKRNFGKKELALIKDKRRKKYEYVIKESNWKDYCSSNSKVKERIKNGDKHTKIILKLARTKKHLTFLEEYELYGRLVLFNNFYYNDNISGRFFTKDVLEWEQTKK